MPDGKVTPDQDAARIIFAHVLQGVLPGPALRRHVRYDEWTDLLRAEGRPYPLADFSEILIVGGGKAAALTAMEILKMLGPERISGALNVYRTQADRPLSKRIKLFPADHPIPNEAGADGARQMIELLRRAGPRTLVLALISGGGSSLMALPVDGIGLQDYREMSRLLLSVPATIDEVNSVRKHIDRLKGGRMRTFAVRAGGFVSLVISDVPVTSSGLPDDPSVIASGPTVGDPSTFAMAAEVLEKYGIWDRTPAAIREYLRSNIGSARNETLSPDSPLLGPERSQYVIFANNDLAMTAAAEKSAELGYSVRMIGGTPDSAASKIRGEVAREIERIFEIIAPECGPRDRVTFASFATDGIDGNSKLAGAMADGDTWELARSRGLDPEPFLSRFDSAGFFERLGLGIETGPSGTNVADICLVLIRGVERKLAFVFGGEATVKMISPEGRAPGRGGRNTHLALLAAGKLRDCGARRDQRD